MKENKQFLYLLCPACQESLNVYQNPTIDDAMVFRSFDKLEIPDEIYHPHWPSFELRGRVDHTLQQDNLRIYFSKLESLARNHLRVKPVDILPIFERHPLICSVFKIPDSIFSLCLHHSDEEKFKATSTCEISLVGLKESKGKIVEQHHVATIAKFSTWGKAPGHL